MKRTAIGFVLVFALVALPLWSGAQEKKTDAPETSITGCFNKSDMAGYYVITDETSGKKVTVMGDEAMLARHANNHKVKLTGAMAKEKDKDVLKASKLQMLAVCP